ncbi:MAG TPA: DUF3017 domain-containing protein [Sporichthya sp.]|nr:DUF3017 domain-containing protein [Sporichthya sp.]
MSPPPRRPPGPVRTRVVVAEWPLATVLAVCTAGVLVVVSEHFRRGTVLFAGGLVLAAGLRALLPTESAGLLVVRGRLVDVITLTALGLGVLLAALVVPPPS